MIKEDIVGIDIAKGNIFRSFAAKALGEGDSLGDRFGVAVYRNGEPENIANQTMTGFFIRPNGDTVVINNGQISGNVAYITLPQSCYVYEGSFSLVLKMTRPNNDTATVRIVDGVVVNTTTETQIDPGSTIPSIEDLLAIVAQFEDLPFSVANGMVHITYTT